MGILKTRLKTLSGLVVYALVEAMLHFILFGASGCALDTFVTLTSTIIFSEITFIPCFNNSVLIQQELKI